MVMAATKTMAQSVSVDQNNRWPRHPSTDRDPAGAMRLPKDVLARVDKWAEANNRSRADAIWCLVEIGLERAPVRQASDLPPLMGTARPGTARPR
jgi:hypothetical protein